MIDEMKPWYDNYCFSEDTLHTQSKVFNSDMVIYYLRNYIDRGSSKADDRSKHEDRLQQDEETSSVG